MKTKQPSKFGNDKKVLSFLKELNDYEYILVGHLIDFSRNVQKVIKTYEIPKDEFCQQVKIKPSQYDAFYKGAFNYDLKHIVAVELLWKNKAIEQIYNQKLLKIGIEKK